MNTMTFLEFWNEHYWSLTAFATLWIALPHLCFVLYLMEKSQRGQGSKT